MDVDDLEPKQQKQVLKNLDELSIEALGEYIKDIEVEILRVRAAITAKELARDGADSVFKS